MDVSVLEAVTVLDVLLMLLAIALAFTLYQCALCVNDRVSRTEGIARATWFAVGVILLGGGLWALGVSVVLPFRAPGTVGFRVLPALLSGAIAGAAAAFALVALQLERSAWTRVAAGALLWGTAVPVVLYLDVTGMGWRGAMRVRD